MTGTIKKYYGALTLLCVLMGLLFPQFSVFSVYTPLLLALLVFSLVIEHSLEDFGRIIQHPQFLGLVSVSNFLLYPLLGFLFIKIFNFSGDIVAGIILLSFAPSPVVAALWTELSGGDGTPALSAALTSMLLSVAVYPAVLYIMGVASLSVAFRVFELLVFTVFLPAVFALLLKLEEERFIPAGKTLNFLSAILGLVIIVVAVAHMSGSVRSMEVTDVIIVVSLMVIAGFIYGFMAGRFRRDEYSVAYVYTSGMRDGVIPLGVALKYFLPSTALPVTVLLVIMPVFTGIFYYVVSR
ncbi:bile acid:sodium symporter family protein [Methanothermobacter marburgensis]|uniref:bile acid:sodium symporter family protein n=1 Tax=Methanothermobacter marburgensis TaxID=145263 RepID=UPI0035B6B85B